MSTVEHIPKLAAGQRLSRDEFLRRWEMMPGLKFAELIDGVVYMPSPLSIEHGASDANVSGWLFSYMVATPGCEVANNATSLMGSQAPQPDTYLRILPKFGGQSGVSGIYVSGAPELIAEVCVSSSAYDLGPKLQLYRRSNVLEYIAILVQERELRWHRLIDGEYQLIEPDKEGLIRSSIFPGLWLHVEAMLDRDMARVLAELQRGLATPEHADFVEHLQRTHETY